MFTEWSEVEDDLRQYKDRNGNPVFDIGEIKKELVRGFDLDRNLAELRQKQVAGELNVKDHFHMPGIGECVARIDLGAYMYWAQRETPDCWKDKGFMREYLRDNPDVRVKSQSRSTSIIVP